MPDPNTSRCLKLAALRHEHAHQLMGKAVRPIYYVDMDGYPLHEGSCVLVEIDEEKYVITASHVIDASTKHDSALYIGGADSLVEISGGDYLRSPRSGDNANDDPYDFAVWKGSAQAIAALGDLPYISSRQFSLAPSTAAGNVYSVFGYPTTKNRFRQRKQRRVKSQLWHYYSVTRDGAKAAEKMGVDGVHHIFIGYDKHSKWPNGRRIDSLKPQGASGGALIDLGDCSDLESARSDGEFVPKLAGIFIEHHNKVLISTRIGVILQSLQDAGYI
ncbi:hypothetical protein [Cupriavidus sp. UME77]|uniref:hypothetical protein n=1 Tax=Cupriavidus sp. UME77 TaxID=1862321 RepID=UPI001603F672|nr:hypothetical protein [Cupriavidus sp. UME77]MBB1632466.1 hypothetical protein [Cupriavidus sp. UME77]